MQPASRLLRFRSLTQEEVEEVVGGRPAGGAAVEVQALRDVGKRRELRHLRQVQQVLELLHSVVLDLVRVGDAVENLVQLLLLRLLRSEEHTSELQSPDH